MKNAIELKNVHYDFNGHGDSHCFSATLYFNGKRAFIVRDSGWGGCLDTDVLNHKQSRTEYHANLKAVDNYIATLPKIKDKYFPDGLVPDLDIVVGELVNDWLLDREIKKDLKRAIVFVTPEKKGIRLMGAKTLKLHGRDKIRAHVTSKYKNVRFLDDMEPAERRELYLAEG